MKTICDAKNVTLNLDFAPSKLYVANKLRKAGIDCAVMDGHYLINVEEGIFEIKINRKHTMAWLVEF